MKGFLFALAAGALLTLQGAANAAISASIGTWQTATITQFTGFAAAFLVMLLVRDTDWRGLRKVKRLYLTGGSFGAIIVFSNVTAIQQIGVTLTVSALLISQLCLTFLIDSNGWFGVVRQRMRLPQLLGIAMMLAGIVILKLS
ncbi:DMT family transporter [Brevibacillus sp. GCM10020057]|uniref:DMT family transporter n=1 Tax=Brevibacillus sp. GCM10020057 TaxID=3317327 RepID=UPI003638FBFB